MATYRKKGNNISAHPAPITRELYACICYGCDQYFYVERGVFAVHLIRCPLCKAPKSEAEVLGIGTATITMKQV